MTELGRQVLVVMAVLLMTLGPAFAAGWFLMRRKRVERARRRSPLTGDLLRAPGQSLREQLEELRLDIAMDLALLLFVPSMPLAVFFMQGVVQGRVTPLPIVGLALCLVAGFVVYQVRSMLRRSAVMDGLRLGLDAELAVGEELLQLGNRGAVVFPDFPAEKFNIDHVVVAPDGVFAIETKGFSKPNRGQGKADATVIFDGTALKFPTWVTRDPIEQAERQADWLGKWLGRATGSPVRVVPVVALPGWFVERTGRGAVRVFSGRELAGLLKARGAQPLSPEDVRRVAHQLEQRCRTVGPQFAPVEQGSSAV